MTLLERFIVFNDWSISRKSALLMGLALPAHLTAYGSSRAAFAKSGVLDLQIFDRAFQYGTLATTLCLIASLIAVWAAREGRWTGHLIIILYGGFVVVLIHILGTWSTPALATWPLVVILVATWYGTRFGWYAFCYGILLALGARALEGSGVLPYAPALLERSVDAQQSAWWVIGNILVVANYFVFCFALSMLVAAARQLQDERLREAHAQLAQGNELIRRYVPSQLAERIITGEHVEDARPERTKLTVFFSDIEGFTQASDMLDPEELTTLLNEYLSLMAQTAERYEATINQFVGDGIMIFFGAPKATNDKDHALRAVRMALDMQRAMQVLANAWHERGIERPFRIRIGINTGYASVGDFGSPGRKTYSAIGMHTNLAARIQALCEPGKILISHATWAQVHDEIPCVAKGEHQIKGVRHPVSLYEVAESAAAAAPRKIIQWPRGAN